MTMTNKQYKQAREEHQEAEELYTFENEHFNGYTYWLSRYMTSEDQKDMRRAYKSEKENNGAFALEGFNGRALILPNDAENTLILRSYYTDVCSYNPKTGEFYKLWEGYSNTTLKHINIFRQFLGFNTISKREWIEMEVI